MGTSVSTQNDISNLRIEDGEAQLRELGSNITLVSSCGDDDTCLPRRGEEPVLVMDACELDVGATHYIEHMCIASGRSISPSAYDIYANDMCGRLGNIDGEWNPIKTYIPNEVSGNRVIADDEYHPIIDCTSDTCNQYKVHLMDDQLVDFGENCCSGTAYYETCSDCVEGWGCTTPGKQFPCIRGNPLGNPLLCCFNDRYGTNDREACYSSEGNNRNTCNKCQRDITSNNDQNVTITSYNEFGVNTGVDSVPCRELDNQVSYNGMTGCQDIAFHYCLGEDLPPEDTSWVYRWMNSDGTPREYELNNPSCHYALLRNVGVRPTAQGLQSEVTDACFPQPIAVDDPTDLRWAQLLMNAALSKHQRQGYTIPSPLNSPGYSLFQQYLKNNVCCPYPILCQQGLEYSCYGLDINRVSEDTELSDWCGCYLSNSEYEEYINNFGVNRTCTPTCNRTSSIKRVGADNSYIPCTQGVCIIDDVTINIANSTGGDVNIEQLCSGCPSGNCTCIISDATVDIANSQFGEVNIQNKCGTIQCSDEYGSLHPCVDQVTSTLWWNIAYLIIAIVIVILFIILCLYLIWLGSDDPTPDKIVIRKKS